MKRRRGLKWIITIGSAVILVILLRLFLFTSILIPSSGMENTLLQGDRVIVNKCCYKPVKKNDIIVFRNPMNGLSKRFSEKDIFINRCAGLPGESIEMDSAYRIKNERLTPDKKSLYVYPAINEYKLQKMLSALQIENNYLLGKKDIKTNIRAFSLYEYYLIQQTMSSDCWINPLQKQEECDKRTFIIPAKGKTIVIHPWNITLLYNTIVLHEKQRAEIKGDTLYVNNKAIKAYTFSQNYYWVTSDNSINLCDSRMFGLVPQDHVIGKASWIWFSKEPNTDVRYGYRWERFFKSIY